MSKINLMSSSFTKRNVKDVIIENLILQNYTT